MKLCACVIWFTLRHLELLLHVHVEAEGVLVVSFASQTRPTPVGIAFNITHVCDTESNLDLKHNYLKAVFPVNLDNSQFCG